MGSSWTSWVAGLALAACEDGGGLTDAGVPTRPDAGKPDAGVSAAPGSAVAVDGGFCCAASAAPGCCMSYGGFVRDAQACGVTCDGMPLPGPGWTSRRDQHGCEYWLEPDVWTDCCGCAPQDLDAGAERCDPRGSWRITWDHGYQRCGPASELSLEIEQAAGAAQPSVRFVGHGLQASSCSPADHSSYETSIERLDGGCRFALGYTSRWCAYSEPQCEVQKLELRIGVDRADVSGQYRMCWCTSTPLEPNIYTQVTGRAERVR